MNTVMIASNTTGPNFPETNRLNGNAIGAELKMQIYVKPFLNSYWYKALYLVCNLYPLLVLFIARPLVAVARL